MDWTTAFVLLLLGILSTASSAIGLQCLNKTDDGKSSSNHGYLSFILGVSVLAMVTALAVGAFKYTESTKTVPVNKSVLQAALASSKTV
jgi:hypothetical protein